jgi:hypothetical protein
MFKLFFYSSSSCHAISCFPFCAVSRNCLSTEFRLFNQGLCHVVWHMCFSSGMPCLSSVRQVIVAWHSCVVTQRYCLEVTVCSRHWVVASCFVSLDIRCSPQGIVRGSFGVLGHRQLPAGASHAVRLHTQPRREHSLFQARPLHGSSIGRRNSRHRAACVEP